VGGTGGAADAGIETGPDAGMGTLTGNCANLTCLNDLTVLMDGCSPSGTCTTQSATSTTASTINECFANGVKVQVAMGIAATSPFTETVKKGSSLCYSLVLTGLASTSSGDLTIVVKDASEATVATIISDSSGTSSKVTCPNGATGVVDGTCGSLNDSTSSSSSTATCTEGTCDF
jgi:hypothetical protein